MVKLRRNLNRPLTWDEMDDNFASLDVRVTSVRFFDTLQEALDLQPRPGNGVAFQVRKETDPENFGFYVFDNREAVGYRYLGERWSDEYLNEIEGQIEDFEQDVNTRVDGLEDIVVGIGSGEGGKAYDSLADALAAGIPDNVVFQTPEGIWRRDSSLPEGAEFLRDSPLDEDEIKSRILPPYREFLDFDRPDLFGKVVFVDKDLNIISISGDSKDGLEIVTGFYRPDLVYAIIDIDGYIIESEQRYDSGGGSQPDPTPTPDIPIDFNSFDDYDRPDLGFAVVDKDNRILFDPNDMRTEYVPVSDVPLGFWNPPLIDGFDVRGVTDPDGHLVLDYDFLISKWDELLIPSNPDLDTYGVKEQIGVSSVGNIPLYRYNFTPQNPKHKVMLIAGSHAHEKKYIYILYKFFEYLINHWWEDEILSWMRWNVDFTILPSRSPYSLSFENAVLGRRLIPETEPIPISWTRTGTDVTLTFDLSDFPEDDFLSGENYFSEYADTMEREGSLGIISSSDEASLPLDAYKIKTVLEGNSVVIEVPEDVGSASGTGELQVWADPNRNWEVKNKTIWQDFVGSDSKVSFDDGNGFGYHDARGTRPYSLRENRALKTLLDNNDHDFIIDLHGPAADHYFTYMPEMWSSAIYEAIDKMKFFSGQFVETDFSRVSKSTYTGSKGLPYLTNYHASFNKGRIHTIEWGGHTQYAESVDVQNAMRWMTVAVTELAKLKNR